MAPRPQRLHQLEIAARHFVEPAEFVAAAQLGPAEVRKSLRLQLEDVAQQGAGGADARGVLGREAEAVERRELEPPGQFFGGEVDVEFPLLPVRPHHAVVEGRRRRPGARSRPATGG